MMHLTFRDLQVSQATYVRLNRGDPTEVGPAADLFRGSSLMVSQVKQEPLELRQEIRLDDGQVSSKHLNHSSSLACHLLLPYASIE